MKSLVVSKFGGTSMANAEAMLRSAHIAKKRQSSVVVVSATSGTTDKLLELIKKAETGNWNECEVILTHLQEKHFKIATDLKANTDQLQKLILELATMTRGISLLKECSPRTKDQILSFGELSSSLLFHTAMQTITSATVEWLDVRDIMITDSHFSKGTPLISKIAEKAKTRLNFQDKKIYVTQGFIGKDENGSTTVLGRGGSDYSAALIAEAVNATLLEIWTDVAGIASTDPRICKQAKMIDEITYDEASEMAHYGAKVLHPTTLAPAVRKHIPVFVGSSYEENEKGTWIREHVEIKPLVRAIAKRNKQALLTLSTPEMLNAYGFMAKIFEVFGRHRISVDCITTSEISVAVTVDLETLDNKNFLQELENLGNVNIEKDHALVSIIGNGMLEKSGVGKIIFEALQDVNIRMMSLGASPYNFNLLVKESEADYCIKKLHAEFIEKD